MSLAFSARTSADAASATLGATPSNTISDDDSSRVSGMTAIIDRRVTTERSKSDAILLLTNPVRASHIPGCARGTPIVLIELLQQNGVEQAGRVLGQYEIAVREVPVGDLMDGGQVRHLVGQLQRVAIVDDMIVQPVVHHDRYGGTGQIVQRGGRAPQRAVLGEPGRPYDLREVVQLAERCAGREVAEKDAQHSLPEHGKERATSALRIWQPTLARTGEAETLTSSTWAGFLPATSYSSSRHTVTFPSAHTIFTSGAMNRRFGRISRRPAASSAATSGSASVTNVRTIRPSSRYMYTEGEMACMSISFALYSGRSDSSTNSTIVPWEKPP
uniref:Uncharacterized protein n=1 Tax=Anopheles merus TaxID=30066 RepID=A0A182V5E9_ANOME